MKPKPNLLFFIFSLVAIAEISLLANDGESYRYLTKPLIIPSLAAIYLTSVRTKINPLKDALLWGLAFSWMGDLLLQKEAYFVPGLASFLTAHVFYIFFFSRTVSQQTSFFKLRPVMLIAVIAYLVELLYLLWPHLGEMKIPVALYGVTISVMLSAALWQYQKLDNQTALFFVIGALLFVISDSILALNKFRSPFEQSGIFIMSTYILAQLFIVIGAIRYRNTIDSSLSEEA
ncbi:MAG: hypothetical protein RL131_931 [Bacteroidota bacterium]